ncbi:hypothetical protein [Streptomyces sp. NPDC048508]|uniref:hypothetical protein n=1 Tax=Streptomyces sp. NPDC048508 TaxID=3365561 RepID=UPI003713CAE0
MPHTTDKRTREELARLLYLGKLQATDRRPVLDTIDRGQLAFQALLFECLMSLRDRPHPLAQPRKSAMASISGYLNVICRQPRHLDLSVARARQYASAITSPAFATAVHTFIDVLLGQGSKPSLARSSKTIENYVAALLDTIKAWGAQGLGDPREITKKHIEDALKPLRGDQARRLHSALRTLFRALKRERLIFRDPARSISLAINRPVPTALPSDRVAGLLDRIDDPRERLMVALVAIYAFLPGQLVQLRRTDFDRSKGRLRLRRPGRTDHVVYLDEFTLRLATAWELHRHHRWPDSSNAHLFVNRNTAVDDSGQPISTAAVTLLFQRIGVPAGRLRMDRIVDEARHSADPLRLMELFGLSTYSATRYVLTAHPDKKPGPIAP